MAANSNEDMPSVAGFKEESSPSQINTVENDDEDNVERAAIAENSDLIKNPEEHGTPVDIAQTTKENDDNNQLEEACASEQIQDMEEINTKETTNFQNVDENKASGKEMNTALTTDEVADLQSADDHNSTRNGNQSVSNMERSDNLEKTVEESTTAVEDSEEQMVHVQATGEEESEEKEEYPVTEDKSETVVEFENAADSEDTADQNEEIKNSEAHHASIEDFANDLTIVKEPVPVSSDLDVPVDDLTGDENTSVEDIMESAGDSAVSVSLGLRDSAIKEPVGSTSEDSQGATLVEEPEDSQDATPVEEPNDSQDATPVDEPEDIQNTTPVDEPEDNQDATPVKEPENIPDTTPVEEPEDRQDATPVDEQTESVAEKQNNLSAVDIDEKVTENQNDFDEELESKTDKKETVHKDAEYPAEINEKNGDAEEDTEMETGPSEPTNEVKTKSIEDSESVMETDQEENSSITTKDTADEKKETESIADSPTVMETDQIKQPATEENKDEGKEDTNESKQENEKKEPKEETKPVDEEAIDIPEKNERSQEKDLNDQPAEEIKKLSKKDVSLDDSKSKDSGDDVSIVGIESKSSEPLTVEDDPKEGEKKDRTSKATQNKDSSKESKSKTPQKCIVCQKVHVGRCNTPTMSVRPRKVPRLTQKDPAKLKIASHIKNKTQVLYGKVTKPKSNSSKITQKLLHNALLSKEFKKQKTSTNIVMGRMANKMAKISAKKVAKLKIDRSGTKILDIAVKFLKLNLKNKLINNSTNKTRPVTKSKHLRPTNSLASRSTKSLKAAKLLLTSRCGQHLVNKNLKKKYTRLTIKPKLKNRSEKELYDTTSEESRLHSIHKLEYIRRDNYEKKIQSPNFVLDLDKTLSSDRNPNEHISVDNKAISCNNTPKCGLEKQIERRYVKVHLNALNISGSTVILSSTEEKSPISLKKSRSSKRGFGKSAQSKFKSSESKMNLKSAKTNIRKKFATINAQDALRKPASDCFIKKLKSSNLKTQNGEINNRTRSRREIVRRRTLTRKLHNLKQFRDGKCVKNQPEKGKTLKRTQTVKKNCTLKKSNSVITCTPSEKKSPQQEKVSHQKILRSSYSPGIKTRRNSERGLLLGLPINVKKKTANNAQKRLNRFKNTGTSKTIVKTLQNANAFQRFSRNSKFGSKLTRRTRSTVSAKNSLDGLKIERSSRSYYKVPRSRLSQSLHNNNKSVEVNSSNAYILRKKTKGGLCKSLNIDTKTSDVSTTSFRKMTRNTEHNVGLHKSVNIKAKQCDVNANVTYNLKKMTRSNKIKNDLHVGSTYKSDYKPSRSSNTSETNSVTCDQYKRATRNSKVDHSYFDYLKDGPSLKQVGQLEILNTERKNSADIKKSRLKSTMLHKLEESTPITQSYNKRIFSTPTNVQKFSVIKASVSDKIPRTRKSKKDTGLEVPLQNNKAFRNCLDEMPPQFQSTPYSKSCEPPPGIKMGIKRSNTSGKYSSCNGDGNTSADSFYTVVERNDRGKFKLVKQMIQSPRGSYKTIERNHKGQFKKLEQTGAQRGMVAVKQSSLTKSSSAHQALWQSSINGDNDNCDSDIVDSDNESENLPANDSYDEQPSTTLSSFTLDAHKQNKPKRSKTKRKSFSKYNVLKSSVQTQTDNLSETSVKTEPVDWELSSPTDPKRSRLSSTLQTTESMWIHALEMFSRESSGIATSPNISNGTKSKTLHNITPELSSKGSKKRTNSGINQDQQTLFFQDSPIAEENTPVRRSSREKKLSGWFKKILANKTAAATPTAATPARNQANQNMPLISQVVSLAPDQVSVIQSPVENQGSKVKGVTAAILSPGNQATKTVTKTVKETTTQTKVLIQPPPSKTTKNKSMLCKPFTQTKATSCRPHAQSKETQTGDDLITKPALVPIPLPMYVPAPMAMYCIPVPYPVPIPIPIPVPCFIPTTKKSSSGILKQITKIQSSMPADPFEAELLGMAAALAGEDNESSSSEDEDNDQYESLTTQQNNTPHLQQAASVVENNVDMLQLAMRMTMPQNSGEAALDLENSLAPTPINPENAPMPTYPSQMDHLHEIVTPEPVHRGRARGKRRGGSRGSRSGSSKKMKIEEQEPTPEPLQQVVPQQPPPDENMVLKFTYGVNAWKHWVVQKNEQLQKASTRSRGRLKLYKSDILACTPDELNFSLCQFVNEVRKPNGEEYAPDSIYYLCLGIQEYLYENGRVDNIFTDVYYDRFTECLDDVIKRYEVRLNAQGLIVCRIEEEHLWESKQLGAHSPFVLLNTLIYFNARYFMLRTPEEHLRLSFSHIMKHWKKTNLPGSRQPGRSVYLRYYAPVHQAEMGNKRRREDLPVFEQGENIENPLRCPVKLYEFYLSKCPESIKNRNDVFYLMPERSCVPDSPVWYSTGSLPIEIMTRMLNRIRVIKEIQEAHLAYQPMGLV